MKQNLKNKLLLLNIFDDNEYLDKYVELIENNQSTKKTKFKTQKHHIIPRCYYEENDLQIDNSKDNIVNLLYKDHILAHCFLLLSSNNKLFKYNNLLALKFITGQLEIDVKLLMTEYELNKLQLCYEQEKELLSLYNPMYNIDVKEHHANSMRNKEVRDKISATMKQKYQNGELFSDEQRVKLSESLKGRIYIHKNGVYTSIRPEDKDKYLLDGWELGGIPLTESHRQALINSHLGKKYSDELRKKLSDAHKGHSPANKGIPLSDEQKQFLSNYFKGTRWMNNGVIQKQVKEENIEDYKSRGFVFGQLKRNKKGGDVNG